MNRSSWLAAVASGALLLGGCAGSEDENILYPPQPGAPPGNPGGGGGGEDPEDPQDPEDPEDPEDPVDPTSWSFTPVYGVPNLDDDDLDEQALPDFFQYLFETDDDVSLFTIPADLFAEGEQIRIVLSGDTDAIRVWHAGEPAVGNSAPDDALDYTLTTTAEDVVLPIEYGTYNVAGILVVEHLDASGALIESTEVSLRSSPLIMNHHLQPSLHTYALEVSAEDYSNAEFIDTYETVLGDAFSTGDGATYGWDVWVQDEFEFATSVGNGGEYLDTVIDSVRNRGLDDYPEDLIVEPGFAIDTWGNPSLTTSYDSFGNLEASPPVTVDGVEYPFGRIYYGREQGQGLQLGLADFLASQTVQEPFELDTTWLCVGHVDEYSSFVPDASSPKGFKLLLADIPTGYAVLESMDPSTSLPRFAADHGYATVGDILNDSELTDLNDDLQTIYLDTIKQKFMDELDLTEDDIILVPSIFEEVRGCGGGVVALIPGMVNLIVADDDTGDTHLFIPDPYVRTDENDESSDPILQAFANALPSELELHFVDNWDVYHMGLGEVHCGSNVLRESAANWFEVAGDLLGGL